MRTLLSRIPILCFSIVALTLLVSRASAEDVDVSGRYECASAKLAGKVVKCTAAPLTLKHDGRFELRGWKAPTW